MKLDQTDYDKALNFRGYMLVPKNVFNEITPFLMRDQEKMHILLRDMPVTQVKPPWAQEQPVEAIEWSGYIILEEPAEG